MKNHFKIALYFFALFASIGAKASLPQSDDSLLIVHQKQDSINFVANLVGLRDLWWVQKAAANKYLLLPLILPTNVSFASQPTCPPNLNPASAVVELF